MKKMLAVGCSFTKGTGLKDEDKNPRLWINQLHKMIWPDHELLNLAQVGKNNEWIFFETMTALIKERYDVVVVAWTSIPRFNITVGLELYCTETRLTDDGAEIRLNSGDVFTTKYQKKIGDYVRRLHHDHWGILNMIKCINTLIEIQKLHQGEIWFVNALGPWSNGYFEKKVIKYPNDLTEYEKKLLSIQTRDDEEIFKLYEKIHNEYAYYGGIHEDRWVNLYESLVSIAIDHASLTDKHPGVLSQDLFVETLKQKFLL